MLWDSPPKLSNATKEQQDKINAFHKYLTDPQQVLCSGDKIIISSLCDESPDVSRLNEDMYNDKCNAFKKDFVRLVFARGLYAAAEDSTSSTLTLATRESDNDIHIATLSTIGRLLTTIHAGKPGTESFRQISFMCPDDDPSNLHVNSFEGTAKGLSELIKKAGRHFEDFKKGYNAMRPDSVVFAGVEIGERKSSKKSFAQKSKHPKLKK